MSLFKEKRRAIKAVAGFVLACAMIAALPFAACGSQDSAPETQTDEEQEVPSKPDKEESKYSQILQTVLDSNYYNEMIDKSMEENSAIFFSNPNFAPIPYAFLQQNGFNVAAIRDRQLKCNTEMYFIGDDTNNLYMSVHVQNDESTITDYVLKYNITDKEYNDLQMLFEEDYIQAPLFIQELSNQKTASVQSKISLTKNAYDIAKEYFVDDFFADLLNSSTTNFDITYLSANSNEIEVNVRGVSQEENVSKEMRLFEGVMKDSCYLTENNNIFNFDRTAYYTDEVNNAGQTIHYLGLESGYTVDNFNHVNK